MAHRTSNIFDEVPELADALSGLPESSRAAYSEAFERLAIDDPTGATILAHGFLLAAGCGLKSVTLARLCSRAHVGKATLYRRWPSIEAFRADLIRLTVEASPPGTTSGSLETDVKAWTDGAHPWLKHPDARGMILNLIFAIASGTLEGDALAEATTSVRAAGSSIIRAAIARGEIDREADVDLLAAALLGPSILTLLIERRPPTQTEIDFHHHFFMRLASQRGVPTADWTGVDRRLDLLIDPLSDELDRRAEVDPQRSAVLLAAMRLLLIDGRTDVTTDLLAARANVSKTTIYDRWDNAEEVVTELATVMMLTAQHPPAATSPFEEMQHWLGRLPTWTTSPPVIRAIAMMFHHLVTEEVFHDELVHAQKLWQQMVNDVIARAVARGQAAERIDPAHMVTSMIGPMVQLLMCGQPIDEERTTRLIAAATDMISDL